MPGTEAGALGLTCGKNDPPGTETGELDNGFRWETGNRLSAPLIQRFHSFPPP
jgi:hypothetical protein